VIVACYRWWEGRGPQAADSVRTPGVAAARAAGPVALEGAFDAALCFEGEALSAGAAARALDGALALAEGRAGALPGGRVAWEPVAPASAVANPTPIDALPPGVAAQVFRAMDGWDVVALPDREAWLTFAMAFLRRNVFLRVPHGAAWHSAAANGLATLTVDTHHAEDVAGTAATYGVPCAVVPGWLDDEQAARLGVRPSRTPSWRLSDVLQYAAILPLPGAVPAADDLRGALQRAFASAGAEVVVRD
jgi:hypothetical protein